MPVDHGIRASAAAGAAYASAARPESSQRAAPQDRSAAACAPCRSCPCPCAISSAPCPPRCAARRTAAGAGAALRAAGGVPRRAVRRRAWSGFRQSGRVPARSALLADSAVVFACTSCEACSPQTCGDQLAHTQPCVVAALHGCRARRGGHCSLIHRPTQCRVPTGTKSAPGSGTPELDRVRVSRGRFPSDRAKRPGSPPPTINGSWRGLQMVTAAPRREGRPCLACWQVKRAWQTAPV